MTLRRFLPGLLAGGASLGLMALGPTQPQSVEGPCQVTQFFIVNLGTSHTTMTTTAGQACSFTLFNPDLQVFQTAALVTGRPSHGEASASLLQGGRMAAVSYRAAPGFVGEDRFTATIEPRDKVVIVRVRVGAQPVANRQPPGPGGPSPVGGAATGPVGAIATPLGR